MILDATDWERLLNEDVNDRVLRLAFADCLEERGEIREAAGWRRLVEKNYRPCKCESYCRKRKIDVFVYVWFSSWYNWRCPDGTMYGCPWFTEAFSQGQDVNRAKVHRKQFKMMELGMSKFKIDNKAARGYETIFLAERALAVVLADDELFRKYDYSELFQHGTIRKDRS